jgi:hypothetical protein
LGTDRNWKLDFGVLRYACYQSQMYVLSHFLLHEYLLTLLDPEGDFTAVNTFTEAATPNVANCEAIISIVAAECPMVCAFIMATT